MKPTVVAVDNDGAFLSRLAARWEEVGADSDYELEIIAVRGRNARECVDAAISGIQDLVAHGRVVEVVLTDVVFVEHGDPPSDRSGITLAQELALVVPAIPVVAITKYEKNVRLIAEVSMSQWVLGIVPKSLFEGTDFSRQDVEQLIEGINHRSAFALAGQPKKKAIKRGDEKPRVFVGCSREKLAVAQALQLNLKHSATAVIWTQGMMEPGNSTLYDLCDKASGYQLAVVVLAPDDRTQKRGKWEFSPRDNAVFELGLFMGTLGRQKALALVPNGYQTPISDLFGITPLTYDDSNDITRLREGLGAAATEIQTLLARV